jgi:hypothetical protein
MLDGSLTINRSTPFASIAFRVFARRAAYSSRENFKFGCTTLIVLVSWAASALSSFEK